jgi:S-adenosylmethionine:tRNA ribosyltransferase-isomerase
MKLRDFDFTLPERLIAQHPAPVRDRSRMMVVWRKSGRREHRSFWELPDILGPGDFLVINTTRVFPARLRAVWPGKSEGIEILLLRELVAAEGKWLVLAKPARKAAPGQELRFAEFSARVLEAGESGRRVIQFDTGKNLREAFERIGEPPLPPYIRRRGQNLAEDRRRYQTVYARQSGSIAAPTAGLHFTGDVLRRLEDRGIPICRILLHVGYGTFQRVRCEEICKHRMEPEYYEIDGVTAARIRNYKAEGRRLIAVGTTTTRCLEYLASSGKPLEGADAGYCNLFIYPGFRFHLLDGLLTNFHLPQSTLFLLTCAFAGRELMQDCYREAISKEYRFYSYGDCMLIL